LCSFSFIKFLFNEEKMTRSPEISRYLINLQKETDGAYLYLALANSEKQPKIAELYRRLSASEEKHAGAWEKRLKDAGAQFSSPKPSGRARILAILAKRFGPQFILPTLTSNEQADSRAYDNQPEAESNGMSADEKSHARLLSAASDQSSGLLGADVAQMEGRHRLGGGNALRAAVLGANDGLVSVLSLTMGAAGANLPGHGVLITGIAGLLAGASSMALGEWLSVQSSRELYQRQINIETQEIADHPEEEQEELALIYEGKGLPMERARELAAHITRDKDNLLDTLAREELGIDPKELGGSPWEAGVTSFFLFASGAFIPLFPYIFLHGIPAIVTSLAVGALALFLTGAAITLLTGKSVWVSGFRQVVIGIVAAVLVFGVGRLIGFSVGG
jgi:VIT1/CCC1 family predicted Fe2+/Mn2+ transporter